MSSVYRFALASCCILSLAPTAGLPRAALAATEDASSPSPDVKQLIAKGDLRRAEIELRNASLANPKNADLHIQLADLYLRMQNLPAAEAEARLARTNKGPADEVDPLLARALSQQGKFTELFRDVTPAGREAKAESQVRVALGLAHLQLQELSQAAPLLQDAERLDPSAAAPKTATAQLLLVQGDIAGAQKEIAAASAIAPDDVNVLRVSALILRAQGNKDAAIAKLSELLARHPDDVSGLVLRADTAMSENKLPQVQTDLDHALKIAPTNVAVIFLDGVLLARQGKLQEADAQLSKASAGFNSLPYGYYLQGVVKFRLGQYQQATTDLAKYLARFPNATVAKRLLAVIAIRQRDYDTAIDELKPVVDSDPSDEESTSLLAQAYLATGKRRNDALELYQRLAALHPQDVGTAVNLDVIKIQAGQVEQGLKELDNMVHSAASAAQAGPALVIADLRLGHVSDADAAAQTLVDNNHQDLMAQSLLGMVRMDETKYSEAAAIYKAVVDKDRTLLGAQRSLAQADLALGKTDDAKALMQGLVKEHPDSVADQVMLARIEMRQNDISGAAEVLRRAQQASATDPTPGLTLLRMYGGQKAWDKAWSYAGDLEGQFPVNRSVVSTVAALRAAAGDPKGAALEYSQLLNATPNDADLLASYANYQTQAGDLTGARATLETAHGANPNGFQIMSQLANFDFDHGGLEKGLATARSFAGNQQLASDLISAALYQRANRPQDAVATLTAAMKRNPQISVVLELANALFTAGEKSEAVATLRQWIQDHPGDFDAEILLAQFYQRQSDPSAALQAYESAYKMDPDNWVVANNLAGLYGGKGDARARALGEQAYYLNPGAPTADTYGWALVRTGDARDGLPLLRQAAEALPSNATVLYHLAVALKDTGDIDTARTVLNRLVGSGTSFDDENAAKELLQQLQRG
jgi:putative PEP-CTERM system TPR-repeat lipoprotein